MSNKVTKNSNINTAIIPTVESEFVQWIEEIGEENIIGFLFDNAGRKTFLDDEVFSLEEHFLPSINCLVFTHTTSNFVEYKVYKPIDTIQAIFTADPKDRKNIKSGREFLG